MSEFAMGASFRWTRNVDLSALKLDRDDKLVVIGMYYEENIHGEISMRAFAERHNVPWSTFRDWKKKADLFLAHGIDMFHDRPGRPSYLDSEGIINLRAKVVAATKQQKTLGKREFQECVLEEIAESKRRRGDGVNKIVR